MILPSATDLVHSADARWRASGGRRPVAEAADNGRPGDLPRGRLTASLCLRASRIREGGTPAALYLPAPARKRDEKNGD